MFQTLTGITGPVDVARSVGTTGSVDAARPVAGAGVAE
jgi:hypothetical protein